MHIKVEWDLDGLSAIEAGVPEIVQIPKHLRDNDDISDYLSDTFGWCVLGWVVVDDTITKPKKETLGSMTNLDKDATFEVAVTFSAGYTINLNEICEELEISVSDIDGLGMKYCTLYVDLKDGRQLEYATSAYEAEFDTKYPDCSQTYINNVCVATNREYGGTIKVEPSEPLIYVLCVRQYGAFEPVFASLRRHECEAQKEKYDVPTRIEAVPSPHGL